MKDARVNEDTGRLDAGKGRTEQERFDRGEDAVTDLPALLRTALQAGDTRMGEETVSAASMGSMGAFRSRP